MTGNLPKPVSASEVARIRESIPVHDTSSETCTCTHGDSDHVLYASNCYLCSCNGFVRSEQTH